MESYNRAKGNEDVSTMDGVFATKNITSPALLFNPVQPPQDSQVRARVYIAEVCEPLITVDVELMKEKRIYHALGIAHECQVMHGNVNAVEFSSQWEPVYEREHLTAISSAFPLLLITCDYVERRTPIYGRWVMQGGVVNHVPATAFSEVVTEPAFRSLIERSG